MPAGVSAYVPLANVTLSSNVTTVTFSSISQSYRDLVLVAQTQPTADAYGTLRLNGATSYSYVDMEGNGSAAQSYTGTTYDSILDQPYMRSTSRNILTFHIMDYSATDKHKTILGRHGSVDMVVASAIRYPATTAVTSITFSGATYAAGNTFALYGVSA
jgi:hypothetical protein